MVEQTTVARFELETTDPEQAHDWIRQSYADHTPRLSGDRTSFRMRMASAGVDSFHIDDLQHTMSVDAQVEPNEAVVVAQPRSGCLWAHGPRGEFVQGAGGLILADTVRPSRVASSPIDMQLVRIDTEAARTAAAEVTGVPPSQVRFELSTPVSDSHVRYWLAVVEHVRSILGDDEVAAAPLVRADALRALTTAVLTTFPNNAVQALADRPGRGTPNAEPAVIRRAVEFLDANAHRPIGVGDIAEAARINPRGLQLAFRRHRNLTPLEYLKHVRMDGAHRALQAADPTRGDTVTGIAARWGFSHPGRFAVEYRQRFGCSPGVTLRA